MSDNNTYYYFLPAVRQGLARLIKDKSEDEKRAGIKLNVHLKARDIASKTFENNQEGIEVPVQLYGPGDVLGFSPKIVARTEPQIGAYDFEPNYFPFVEFNNSDFLWRYSPNPVENLENHENVKYIKPWLVLVVLESGTKNNDEEFIKINQSVQGLPDLIKVNTAFLPDLAHNWRWAHVQIAGEENMSDDQRLATLENQSNMVTCRLMCPRRLKSNQKYSSFVLPSTEIGRFAGIDKAILNDKTAYNPAWTTNDVEIEIPYYYSWDFHTGASGDFEHLVRLLEPRKLKNLGTRQIDCSKPGYGTAKINRSVKVEKKDAHTLDMEGALKSLDTKYTPWGADPYLDINESKNIFKVEMLLEPARKAVIVSWQTSSHGDSCLKYGESELTQTIDSDSDINLHSVKLTNLLSDIEYKIKIEFSSPQGMKSIIGTFLIPPGSDLEFQKELATLINKPIAEDLALEQFSIPMDGYDGKINFNAKILPSGSDIEVICQTSFQSTLEIQYGKSNTLTHELSPISDENLSSDHTMVISGLLPDRTYHIKIIAKNSEDDSSEFFESSFTMPPLPTIVPPVYGRWHYGKYRIKNNKKYIVDASYQKNWIDELNLDPRHRSEAALGTQVIRKNQEDLMASAWDQLGAVESVNALLLRKQFARESSKNILNRIAKFSAEKFVVTTIPFQKKIITNNITAHNYLAQQTLIPKAVINLSFQKINTQMHKKKTIDYATDKNDILERFLGDDFTIKQKNIKPSGTMTIDDVTNNMLQQPPTVAYSSTHAVATPSSDTLTSNFFASSINADLISKAFINDPFPSIEGLSEQTTSVETIGGTVDNWLNFNFSTNEISAVENPEEELHDLKTQIIQSLNPEKAFLHNTQQLLRIDGVLQSQFKEVEGDSLDPLMAAPEFPQPMNESLLELSKSLFLPGIEKIKPNTIGLLETNPRFLEAFMCGLNHEFGSELLWRGYPTDQRGSYFRQFWDASYHIPTLTEKQAMLDKWLDEHNIEFIEELSKEKKEMIIYSVMSII